MPVSRLSASSTQLAVGIGTRGTCLRARGTTGDSAGEWTRVSPSVAMVGLLSDFSFGHHCRWDGISAMWTERRLHAAVLVPEFGILVMGGERNFRPTDSVELLQLSGSDEEVISWRRMSPMLRKRRIPSACSFRGSVLVCSVDCTNLDLAVFDIAAAPSGQWTRIECEYDFRWDLAHFLLPMNESLWIAGGFLASSPPRLLHFFPHLCRCSRSRIRRDRKSSPF